MDLSFSPSRRATGWSRENQFIADVPPLATSACPIYSGCGWAGMDVSSEGLSPDVHNYLSTTDAKRVIRETNVKGSPGTTETEQEKEAVPAQCSKAPRLSPAEGREVGGKFVHFSNLHPGPWSIRSCRISVPPLTFPSCIYQLRACVTWVACCAPASGNRGLPVERRLSDRGSPLLLHSSHSRSRGGVRQSTSGWALREAGCLGRMVAEEADNRGTIQKPGPACCERKRSRTARGWQAVQRA